MEGHAPGVLDLSDMNRKSHWENIYREKSAGEVSWYQPTPAMSLELIGNSGIAPDAAIIDVGGGASRLIDYLLDGGYSNLSVLDISEQALLSSQLRLGKSASRIHWYAADITEFEPPRAYSLWHDRAVFHFLTEKEDRSRYLGALNQGLEPGGQLIIAAFAIGGPEKCSGLDVVQYDAHKLRAELGEGFVLVEQRDEIHLTPAGKGQHFCYFRFTRET